MAAFPSLTLSRSGGMQHDKRIQTVTGDDGTSVQLDYGDHWVTVSARFNNLSSTDFSTLSTFLSANRFNVITWTIDSIDYSGYLIGDWRETIVDESNAYTVEFVYLAEEV